MESSTKFSANFGVEALSKCVRQYLSQMKLDRKCVGKDCRMNMDLASRISLRTPLREGVGRIRITNENSRCINLYA